MNIQEPNQSRSKRVLWGLISLGVLLTVWALHVILPGEIVWWLRISLIILLVYFSLALLAYVIRIFASVIFHIHLKREQLRQERERTAEARVSCQKTEAELHEAAAKARKTEQDSQFADITARQDEAVFVRDDNENAVWRPLHLIPSHRLTLRVDGTPYLFLLLHIFSP